MSAAIGEYIGGTDRSNWGKQTRAYIDRVLQGVPQAPVPDPTTDAPAASAAAPGGSTFDRIWSQMAKPQESAIAKVAEAYKAGKMSPDEAQQFEADVKAGRLMLPRGVQIGAQPGQQTAQSLPAGVIKAYQAGKMDPADSAQLERDIRGGMWALPENLQLQAGGGLVARIPASPQIEPLPAPEPGIGAKALGVGEAALSTLTGLTGGAVGLVGGAAKGLAGAVMDGSFGTAAGADAIERSASQGAQALTYAPRTETGAGYAENVGQAMQQLLPAAAVAHGMPPTVRPAGTPGVIARVGAEGAARDAANLVARPAEALGAVAPGAAGEAAAGAAGAAVGAVQSGAQRVAALAKGATTLPRRALESLRGGGDAPAAGTMGSVGAAGADMAAQRVATAQRLPVPLRLTRGEATRDPAQMKFEEGAAKNMEAGQALRDRIVENNARLLSNFDTLVDQTGAQAPSLRATGSAVDQALVKQVAADKARIRAGYAAAERAGEMEAPVTLEGVVRHLNESAPDAATAPLLDVARARAVRLGLAADDGSGNLVAQPVRLKIAETYRQAISRATDYEPTNVRQATILKGLVDEATDGAGGTLYRQARATRARFAQNYENHAVISKLVNLKRGTTDRQVAFEDVFSHSVLKGSLDDVRQVRRVLQRSGEEGQQAWRELQGSAAGWLRDRSTTTATDSAGQRVVSPAALDKAVRELDADGKLDFIFTKRGAQTIRDLRDAAQYVRTAPPEAAINFSNSAWTLLGAFGDVGGMGLTGVPVPAITIGRMGMKYIKDSQLRRRIEDALQDTQRQQAPGQNNPPRRAPNSSRPLP